MMHPALMFMGDGAYVGDSTVLIPFARNQLNPAHGVSAADKQTFNLTLRRERVLVEWTIGRLRQTWHVLHAPFRMDRGRADQLVFACAVLLNFMYAERGTFTLRSPAATEELARRIPAGLDDLV